MKDSPWTIVAAISAAVAAIIAAVQVWLSRRDANRRATLQLLGDLEQRLHPLWPCDTKLLRSEILTHWTKSNHSSSGGNKLSQDAINYLALLNTLDLLGFAVNSGLADTMLTIRNVRTLLDGQFVSLSFVNELQDACRDSNVYSDLRTLLSLTERGKRN
jgi:hypothetical protein